MLLLFDGHLSHISIPVVQRAIEENITLLKFPPHVTDLLQPLDKCCFGPLKQYWEKTLNERINIRGLSKAVDRAEFVNLISSVWHEGMNENNVIAGFETTGIWPLDTEKNDKSRFDPRLVAKYDERIKIGKPPLDRQYCGNLGQMPPPPLESEIVTYSESMSGVNQGEIEVQDEIPTHFEEAATSSLQSNGLHAYPKYFNVLLGLNGYLAGEWYKPILHITELGIYKQLYCLMYRISPLKMYF